MFYAKTLSNMRTTVEEQGNELQAELERATSRLTVTLVIVAALATFAVVYVATNRPQEGIRE